MITSTTSFETFALVRPFGAILFGLSVDRLGVSLANSLVIGLSSALGSLVPLLLHGGFRLGARETVLLLGIATFLAGVYLCGDHRDNASIEGAMVSGRRAAEAVLADLAR